MPSTRIALVLVLAAAAVGATWLTPTNPWKPINSTATDLDAQPIAGGAVLYFVSNRPGGRGGYDIWAAYYGNGAWYNAFNLGLGVNSAGYERSPVLVGGANAELYFASTRPGGKGGFDLCKCAFAHGAWQTADDLTLTALNSTADDTEPFVTSAPRRLLFASNRAGGYGGYDLYRSEYTTDGWTVPVNLGAGVNTPYNELGPACDNSQTRLYFYSDRPGGLGNYDIYAAAAAGATWSGAVNLGAPINTAGLDAMPGLTPEGNKLFFSSTRTGGMGNTDIWVSNLATAISPSSLGRVRATFH